MIVSQIVEDFTIAKEVEEGCSPRTCQAYEYDLGMFIKEIGDVNLENLRSYHIRRFLKVLHDRQYTKAGIARKIACLKSFFKFCEINKICAKNPMRAIKSPKIRQEEQLPKYLTKEEMNQVLNLLQKLKTPTRMPYSTFNRLKIIVPLLYSSMARVSELCDLKLRDVNLDQGFIKVRGKGNKQRYIPIDANTSQKLEEHVENRKLETLDNESIPLFVNYYKNKLEPRTVQRDMKILKKVLGWPKHKKLTPHVFRHTGATHLRQNGMDISELQDILGHANPNTTKIYAKNDINRLKESFEKFHPLAN